MRKLIFYMQISMKACYKLILWFWWRWSNITKISQKSKSVMSLKYLKKEVMKLIFCMSINTKVFYKLTSTLWASKSLKGSPIIIDGHDQACSKSQSNKFCNIFTISHKEVTNGIHFLHAEKHQSFYKLALSFSMEVARHVQST